MATRGTGIEARGQWPAWAGVLVGLYLGTAFAGWQRTLIPDEIWALLYSACSLGEQLRSIRLDLVHPPLMYLVERGWVAAFGDSDNAAKALALIVNIPTIVLFTYLARCVTAHWRVASLLFCSHFLRIGGVSNLVRMYGVVLLLTVTSFVLWERWRKRPTFGALAAWTAVMLLLTYTHYFGLLLLPAFMIVNGRFGPRRWTFVAAASVAGLAIIPWVVWVLPVYLDRGLEQNLAWVDQAPLWAVLKVPFYFLTGPSSGWNPGTEGPPLIAPGLRPVLIVAAGILILALLFAAWQRVYRRRPPLPIAEDSIRWFWATAIWVGVPVLLLYSFSLMVTPAFDARFLVGVIPAFWLAVVLLGQFGGRAGSVLLHGVVLPWVLVGTGVTAVAGARPSALHEGAVRLVDAVQHRDFIICGPAVGPQVYWELTHRLGSAARIEVVSGASSPQWSGALPQQSLEHLDLNGVDRVWVCSRDDQRMAPAMRLLSVSGFVAQEPLQRSAPFLQAFLRVPGHAALANR